MVMGAVFYGLSWLVFVISPWCRRNMERAMKPDAPVPITALAWGLTGLAVCFTGAAMHIAGIILMGVALLRSV